MIPRPKDTVLLNGIAGKVTKTDAHSITVTHRPQWPSMRNDTTIYKTSNGEWCDDEGNPVTLEAVPGPQLVNRKEQC